MELGSREEEGLIGVGDELSRTCQGSYVVSSDPNLGRWIGGKHGQVGKDGWRMQWEEGNGRGAGLQGISLRRALSLLSRQGCKAGVAHSNPLTGGKTKCLVRGASMHSLVQNSLLGGWRGAGVLTSHNACVLYCS